jgi:sulfide:quinone oxidoreductase
MRVLIAGGGPGGVETALALQALGRDRVHVHLLSAEPRFVYRPWSVAEPFGVGRTVALDLERLAADRGWGFTRARVQAVDAPGQAVETDAGRIGYDVLVLALGARQVPAVPGALVFRGPRDAERLRVALEQRVTGAGTRVAYVVRASASWALPAYELALMTRVWGERRATPVHVSVVTAESAPLEAFGPDGSARVRELCAGRGVVVHTRTDVDAFTGGRLLETGAGSIPADVAVALPMLTGPSLAGLPHDAGGFVPVDDWGRVAGHDGVYAIGDMTARPLKQGGLATQQGDVAAARIAAAAGAVCETPGYEPVLRAVLLTGAEPLYLRHPPARGDHTGAGSSAPWWPPHKIAGRHLAPFLATHAELLVAAGADA